jgi:glycosidase
MAPRKWTQVTITRRRAWALLLVGALVGSVLAWWLAGRSQSSSGAGARGATATRPAQPTREQFYFVMTDRFANGDPSNDTGGRSAGPESSGFDPTSAGMNHGGDLRGLTSRLDYVKGLGTTAIWITPPFAGGEPEGSGPELSSDYHGYWIRDFTTVDPHLGTNADLRALVDAAHAKGMKVFLDIVVNHTADQIRYEDGTEYLDSSTHPWKDAKGVPFDPRQFADRADFPALSEDTSFPHKGSGGGKAPDWLNDVTMYHNRGDSSFEGESSEWGDFFGLDDLFTERPEVLDGMIAIYEKWIDVGVDGFRIDTVKHVNLEFWQHFSPALLDYAMSHGKPDFFMFGEVYDVDPTYVSTYTTKGRLQSALDFGFQKAATDWVGGGPGTNLKAFFDQDRVYSDADSSALSLATFLGNHDMGRVGFQLNGASADDAELLQRLRLANALMFTSRGNPVVYYGDEQGLIGTGGDKSARQDLFTTRVAEYATDHYLGTQGARDRYDTSAPLYRDIAELSALRKEYPALADGSTAFLAVPEDVGVLAYSRVDRGSGQELVVLLNNQTTDASVPVRPRSASASWSPVLGAGADLRPGADGTVATTVPALSAFVLLGDVAVDASKR